MLKTRGFIIIITALVVAVITANLLTRYGRDRNAGHVTLMAAAENILPGTALEHRHLKPVTWPASARPQGSFEQAGPLLGRTVSQVIHEGEPLLDIRLGTPGQPETKVEAAGFDPALRAVSVAIDPVSGLSGMIGPGVRVDVIAADNYGGDKNRQVSRIILSGIMVREASRGEILSGFGTLTKKSMVALMLDAEQARILSACRALALKLVKRGRNDTGEVSESMIFSLVDGPSGPSGPGKKREDKVREWNRRLEEEKRAITISFRDDDGICGFIRPGNRVDVMAVSILSNISSEGVQPGAKAKLLATNKIARIILQDLEVLAVDTGAQTSMAFLETGDIKQSSNRKKLFGNSPNNKDGDRPGQTPENKDGARQFSVIGRLTLLTTPEASEKLLAAYQSYQVKLIVRNNDDRKIVLTKGKKLVEAFRNGKGPYTIEFFHGMDELGMGFEEDAALPGDPSHHGLVPDDRKRNNPVGTDRGKIPFETEEI